MYRIGRPRLYVAIILAILLESTFLNLVGIDNIRPNLILILIIFVGLYSDWIEALEAGIVAGLLRGAISTGSIGINLILFGLCGLFSSYCRNKVYKNNFLTQIILTLFLAIGINILSMFAKIVMKDTGFAGIGFRHAVIFPLILMSLYTSFVAPPIFFCLRKIFRIQELEF